MNIIITMAGEGTRFKVAGYAKPKYEIVVCGHTLFEWALMSLKNFNFHNFIFITLERNEARTFIKKKANLLGIKKFRLFELGEITDGQATTAMKAELTIKDINEPVSIYNIDTYVGSEHLKPEYIKGDGWIPCFQAEGDHWSFVRADGAGRVLEVREKKRISPYATVGFYYFSSFALFQNIYSGYYADKVKIESCEKYIAPLYNALLDLGRPVFMHEIPSDAVRGLGTPQEVESFSEK